MSFYTQRTRTVRIDEENTITIRALSYGEEREIEQRSTKVVAKFRQTNSQNGRHNGRSIPPESIEGNTEGQAEVDRVLAERLTLTKSITEWDGPGFEGRKPTSDNIMALPRHVLDPVIEAINELGEEQELTEEEKKD